VGVAEQFHTIVIGAGGAMGSSAAYHLARRGVKFLGLERFAISHTNGSSHGYSRMIRMCYYEHPDYVPLLRRAYELWQQDKSTIRLPGGIFVGREGSDLVAGSRRAALEHGLAHEMLSREQLRERLVGFSLPKDFVGVWEPTAGYLFPERIIARNIEFAAVAGEIRAHEPVVEWHADSSGVRVRTDKREYSAEKLIIAAGVWANRVVRDLGVTITPTRQVLAWVQPHQSPHYDRGRMPVWALQTPPDFDAAESVFYGFPIDIDTGAPGLKVARHVPGSVVDPDASSREAEANDEHEIRPFLKRFMPQADGRLLAIRTCMYENSPDSHFIIDKHPKHENVIVAAGFSGHGFKFASVVGEVLADLAVCGETKQPVGFLGLARFRSASRS
jgi:sarcosine oxidase